MAKRSRRISRNGGPTDVDQIMAAASAAVKKRFKEALSDRASVALALPSVWFSTGALVLDRLCAARNPGGIPQGRVVHIPGDWSTGKSLLLDHLLRSVIRRGGLGLVSETEGTRDPHFAHAIGLDLSKVEIQRPKTIEAMIDEGLEYHDRIRKMPGGADIPILWGVDSLDSSEAEKAAKNGLTEGGGWHYGGGKSEALGAGLRKVVVRCARYPTTVILLNQIRERPSLPGSFGPNKASSGGNPPHFYASLELWLSPSPLGFVRGAYRGSKPSPDVRKRLGLRATDRGDVVGRWVRARVTKTKVAPTVLRECDFYIDFQKGINPWLGMLQQFIKEGRVNVKDTGEVTHRIEEGEVLDFPDATHWMQWLAAHPKYLLPMRDDAPPATDAGVERDEEEVRA